MATSKEKAKKEERKAKARSWSDRQKQHGGGGSKAFKMPEGHEKYELTVGTHKVDVMPFRAGPNCPNGDEGEIMADLEYTVHKIPTPASQFGEHHICKWETWKKPCVPCTHRNTGTSDADLQKQLRPQLRHVFLFNDKPGNAKNRPKIFDIHHFHRGEGFPEKLVDAINVNPEKYDQFYDLENGLTLILTVKQQPMGDGTTKAGITRIDFEPRSYAYPESILDKMPCLDECLIDEDDDSLRDLLGIAGADDDEPAPRKKRVEVDDEEEAPVTKKKVVEDDDEEPVTKKKVVVEDDADDAPPAKKKVVVDDDDDDPPAPKKKAAAVDDDDDLPAPKKKVAVDDDDDPPAKPAAKASIDDEPTAEQYGLKKGNFVTYKGKECEIVNVSGDGTSLTLEDDDGKTYRAVGPDEVKKIKTKDADEEAPAPKKKAAVVDDDDDDPPAKPKKKPAVVDDDDDPPAKPKKKAAVVDDDDDDPPAKPKKKAVVDDDD